MIQEAVRKDVERAFGVLQARFTIVKTPTRLWKQKDIKRVMMTCIILHNMIVEDERGLVNPHYNYDGPSTTNVVSREVNNTDFSAYVERYNDIRNTVVSRQLQDDLKMHIYTEIGRKNNF
jgi:hypothetical protein